MTRRNVVVLACGVLEDLLGKRLPPEIPRTWIDVTLHNSPKKLSVVLQQHLDALPDASTVLLGYGLCGNGLVGVKSGPHTLIIPRTHDCIAIFLGSHQRYVQRFFASPNTYYLTKGWIDAKDEPLTDYRTYVRDYDQDTADYLIDVKYRNYRKLCMVGFSTEELDACRERVMEVAKFLGDRFGLVYEEILGSPALIEGLLALPGSDDSAGSEFVVVPPRGEIDAGMFMREGEAGPQPMGRGE